MQVQWKAIVSGVIIRLSGKMDENEYMAFGISGAEGRTQMVGGDVAVTYFDKETGKFHAKDYVLSAKSQVNNFIALSLDPRYIRISCFFQTFKIIFCCINVKVV